MNALKTLLGKELAAVGINLVPLCINSTTTYSEIKNQMKSQLLYQFFSFYILQAQVLHYNLCPALTSSDLKSTQASARKAD